MKARAAVLEQRLTEETKIAGAAQREAMRLKDALEKKNTDAEENRIQEESLLSSQGDTSGRSRETLMFATTAAIGTAASGEHKPKAADPHAAQEENKTTKIAAATERVAVAERALEETTAACEAAKAESESLGRQLDCARAAEAAEAEEKRAAKDIILGLERAVEDARWEQERTRERAETRLDLLRNTFEQEERENAGKVKGPDMFVVVVLR